MSLYNRIDFTRPTRQQLKHPPIWERIDLTRPPKLRCCTCRIRLQSQWEFCPSCGQNLIDNSDIRRCIWVDVSDMAIAAENRQSMTTLLLDAFSKLYGAFRSVKVFLTYEPPDTQEWEENFTYVDILADDQPVDYLGVATFQLAKVINQEIVRIY